MKEAKDLIKIEKTESGPSLLDMVMTDRKLLDELASMGVGPEEIPFYLNILFDYSEQNKACAKCPGAEKCELPNKNTFMRLEIGDSGRLTYSLGPCPENMRKEKTKSFFLYRDFDDALGAATGGNYKKGFFIQLRPILGNMKKGSDTPWAYLYGDPNVGKSYYLAAVCNDFASRGIRVAYLDFASRCDEFKTLAIRERDRFAKILNELGAVDLLALDNFGDEYKTDYVIDTIINPLLKERSSKKRTTLIASSYSLDDLERMYLGASKTKANAKRLISYIRQNINGEGIELEPMIEVQSFYDKISR